MWDSTGENLPALLKSKKYYFVIWEELNRSLSPTYFRDGTKNPLILDPHMALTGENLPAFAEKQKVLFC